MIRRTPSDGVEVAGGAAVVVTGAGAAGVVTGAGADGAGPRRPPVMVGTAYGGSKSPNRPQALQPDAHELTGFGAARMGSQCGSTKVAIAEGLIDLGQSVPRSLRVS